MLELDISGMGVEVLIGVGRTQETVIIRLLCLFLAAATCGFGGGGGGKKEAKSRSLSCNIKLGEIGQAPFFIYYCHHLWPSNEGSC